MATVGDRVTFREPRGQKVTGIPELDALGKALDEFDRTMKLPVGRRLEGTVKDLQCLSDEAVIETDDGLTHIVAFDAVEQGIERLPEQEYPTFQDAGIPR